MRTRTDSDVTGSDAPSAEPSWRESSRERRRRHGRGALSWSLLVSLLVTHVAMLPLVQLLLVPSAVPEPPIEVELITPEPDTPKKKPRPRLQPPVLPRRLAKAVRKRARAKIELARKKAPKPKPKKRQPKKRKAEPTKPRPPQPPRLKMVELNTPETKRAQKDARFLSDKNRRVTKQTRARHTNLHKDHRRPRPLPTRSATPKKRAGADKPKLAQTEARKRKARRERKRRQAPKSPRRVSPLLAMRRPAQERVEQRAKPAKAGSLPTPQRAQRARRRIDFNLDHHSLDRMYGAEAKRQRELARLRPSKRRGGKIARKWKRMRAALENFIPEVQPGNQTMLGTRANPFAVFIARMHRKIHPLWGYGFLVDLDNKSDRNPLNNMSLRATMEIAVNPDGSVAKATIVRPSGSLVYDVAAIDSIFSAAPYPRPPKAIRSANGKVYMHWSFYRNHRQCGTFNVHPYILTTPPRGPVDGKAVAALPRPRRRVRRLSGRGPLAAGATAIGRRSGGQRRRRHRRYRRGHRHRRYARPPEVKTTGLSAKERQRRLARAKAAARRVVSPADPRARAAAQALISAFRRGDAKAMAAACALPFSNRGRVVAKQRARLVQMFQNLLREAKGRSASALRLMSVLEARRRLGALPKGVQPGEQMLIGTLRLGRARFTLTLQRRQESWKIIALDR